MLTFHHESEYGLHFSKSIKLLHWMADDFNEHIILNELYESFDEKLDDLIEQILGRHGVDGKKPQIKIKFDNSMHMINYCIKYYDDAINRCKHEEIKNTIAEIIAAFNKAKYLMSQVK